MTLQKIEEMIGQYEDAIYNFCVYLTKNRTEADDLYQDTFLKAIERPEKIDKNKNPKNYFLSVAIFLWKSKQRKFMRRSLLAPSESIDDLHQPLDHYNLLDDLLKESLVPTYLPDGTLNSDLKKKIEENIVVKKRVAWKAAVLACAFLFASSVSVYAAVNRLSASEYAKQAEYPILAKAFEENNSLKINETKESGDYKVTMLGITSGKGLTAISEDQQLENEKTYAVVAIEYLKGGFPNTTDEEFDKIGNILVSPLIKGERPWQANIYTMGGSATYSVVDGILYKTIEFDMFKQAEQEELYIAVTDGGISADGYSFDENTGNITPNEEYKGLNMLFDLTIN